MEIPQWVRQHIPVAMVSHHKQFDLQRRAVDIYTPHHPPPPPPGQGLFLFLFFLILGFTEQKLFLRLCEVLHLIKCFYTQGTHDLPK